MAASVGQADPDVAHVRGITPPGQVSVSFYFPKDRHEGVGFEDQLLAETADCLIGLLPWRHKHDVWVQVMPGFPGIGLSVLS
jgi:hypothetical protein